MTALAQTANGNYVWQGKEYSPATIVSALSPLLTENRRLKLENVLSQRSHHCLPVMENIHDIGNINAVMRSAELFGFDRMANIPSSRFKSSSRITSGADKWVKIENFQNPDRCYEALRARGYTICATALRADAIAFPALDLSKPRAFVFGNEKRGVSPRTLELVDECTIIPTVGFTESFNISVAAAIIMSKMRDYIQANGTRFVLSEDEKTAAMARQLLLQFKFSTVAQRLEQLENV